MHAHSRTQHSDPKKYWRRHHDAGITATQSFLFEIMWRLNKRFVFLRFGKDLKLWQDCCQSWSTMLVVQVGRQSWLSRLLSRLLSLHHLAQLLCQFFIYFFFLQLFILIVNKWYKTDYNFTLVLSNWQVSSPPRCSHHLPKPRCKDNLKIIYKGFLYFLFESFCYLNQNIFERV